MKAFFILIVSFLALAINAQSPNTEQPTLTAEQKAKLEVKRMTTDLNLTTVQQQQIEKILMDNNRKTGDIKLRLQSAKPEDNQALKTEYIESLKTLKTNLKAVLTQEQQDKWDAVYKKRFQNQPQKATTQNKP
ncbi:hypothetical protein E6C50_05915 [Flavobacterium supellecticarium]|uniref:LTXXQ motif family protein n=1 Tax=Flavobacterium supellecticarium TaxID=2565924 RepID=A0A4S3ZZ97_9FLAO|nr:hypothetical protein [Flavobacterium supellecticarium]THF51303.1 hypothetical protein E6C50_05915 [Flavobacterium supellecticarium]